jgi:hypothetical protein
MIEPAQPAKAPLRWKRALAFAVAAGAIIFAIAWAPVALQAYENHLERKAAEPRPILASPAQQAAIVRAILMMAPIRMPPPPPPLPGSHHASLPTPSVDPVDRLPLGLLDQTISLRSCDPSRPGRATRCDMGGHMDEQLVAVDRESTFPLAWRRELVAASLEPAPLTDPQVDGVMLVARDSDANDGLAGVSRAVLSADGRAALVYFEIHGPGLGAACIVYRLAHASTGWEVSDQEWHCVG